MSTILIIDDERDIRDLLSYNLEKEGYDILTATNGMEAKNIALSSAPDLILLDLMLPGIDGLELCRIFRSRPETASTTIIMLTAKGEEIDKVLGLELGADDYVTKPFSVRELVARVKAQLRRVNIKPSSQKKRRFGSLQIDLSTHQVSVSGVHVNLSPLEFRLLRFFINNPERVYSRDHLLDVVWGTESFVEPRTVDVHIRRLREKIAPEGARLIKTVRGAGYRFSENSSNE